MTQYHKLDISSFMAVTLWALSMTPAQAATTSRTEYLAAQSRINAEYKVNKEACSTKSGNTKDVCIEEAQAHEKVAQAELTHAHTGTAKDRTKLLVTRAETAYDVAKEKCDDKAGNAKDVCVKEAKAQQTKALADAKLGKEIQESKMDADQDKRKADYAVAAEKCDAMAGDAKASCVSTAKSRFGQD
jgi:hypothetical protein